MAINLRDYGRTSEQRGWGKGWPSCTGAKGRTVVVTAARSNTRISVHRDLSRLVSALLDWTEHPRGGNYQLKPKESGGMNCRPIGRTRRPSNHSWALAVDLNWNDNPYTTTGRRTIPTAVARRWNRYGFAWGGDYSGARKDYMHLEFMGNPTDAAAMTALVLRELHGVQAPASNPARPATTGAVLRLGMKGPEVGRWQAHLNTAYNRFRPELKIDDHFGNATRDRTIAVQRFLGITADGIVGDATRTATRFR